MASQNFTHIHSHGAYSCLDGVRNPDKVSKMIAEKGFKALALTDHGSVSGVLQHLESCTRDNIKGIGGCEVYVVDNPSWRVGVDERKKEDRYHTVVLAKDWDGFISLQKLLTHAHSEQGFYYKPRCSFEQLYELKNCIVTSACVSGPFKHPEWNKRICEYNDAFGEDFYLEIQPHNLDNSMQLDTNAKAQEMSKFLGRKLVASNDFHYVEEDEFEAQKALTAIRDKNTENSEKIWECIRGLHARTFDEMLDAFDRLLPKGSKLTKEVVTQALHVTNEIVDKCNLVVPKFDFTLPDIDTAELNTDDPDKALLRLCVKGWEKRFKFSHNSTEGKKYFDRMMYELNVIYGKKFSKYFLLVWDIFRYCDKNDIARGAGRGSCGGSLVCYLIGISAVDPLPHGLLFERFLSPVRTDWPDIDLDFAHERREEVYQYMLSTYKHVAHIPTFNGMNAKMVLKDIARYKEVPVSEVNMVSKEIDKNTAKQDMAGITLSKLEEQPNKYPIFQNFAKRNPSVLKIAKVLEGQIRQSGVHAGGVIVSGEPLENRCGIEYRKGQVCINFDMYDVDKLALLKVDVLGAKTVSVIDYAVKLINKTASNYTDKKLRLDAIPLDDKLVLRNFDQGNTTGIFQFESDGIRQLLKEMAPNNFESIIAANAIYRPGPLQFKDIYNRNKRNPALIQKSGNESLDRIIGETFGVFIYQEQVMKIAVEVAGYSFPDSDVLRKKIAKSKGKDEVEKDREKFVDGCVSHGRLDRNFANKIFDQIVDFGRYAFNKSHSTTYSLTSYYAMWCKTHFPNEFLCAQIAYTEDKTDRLKFKNEVNRLGLKYLPPDINKSGKICSIHRDGNKTFLLGGFNEIDGIGNAVIDEILNNRGNKVFSSYEEFMDNLENKRIINIGVQQALLKAGVFDTLHSRTEINERIKKLENSKTKKTAVKNNVETVSLF